MSKLVPGQRFISETEPELGLGLISGVESKTLKIIFLASGQERVYGIKGAPIKRVLFSVGDEITLRNGQKFTIESIEENDGLVIYGSGVEKIDERELGDALAFNKPEDRIFNGTVDRAGLFNLRNKTLHYKNILTQSPVRGLIGGRMNLIPHQFYVAKKISERSIARVLLADEVGLGKTIQAGLAIHHLILSERVKRVLILVPDSLVYQWFIEMLKKFNLSFTTFNQETHLEPNTNPFADNDLVIVNIGLLKGADIARKMMNEVTWDLMVVDEAHQLKWSPEKVSPEYKIVEQMATSTKALLLLTATPEQLGLEGHFARLKLLDPDRFYDLEKFLAESKTYVETANKARELLSANDEKSQNELKLLQDLHGPGRIFFRNTRQRMGKHFSFFPKRNLHTYPLTNEETQFLSLEDEESIGPGFDLKLDWLTDFIEQHKNEKVLLLTKSKTQVMCLERLLKDRFPSMNIGAFHSSLSFLARDRQAAFFADPEGANLLLCTEVGSEGRNFEFASHLVLFDLPKYPDLLEQRIGRLDRIGQKRDINIHVPYVLTSYEEVLFQWFHIGLDAFENSAKGASLVHAQFESELGSYLMNPKKLLGKSENLTDFLTRVKAEFAKVVAGLEEGRDILVELNSFKEEEAYKLIHEIQAFDEEADLYAFMNEIFSEIGVEVEDLSDEVYFLRPHENMSIPYFPSLPPEGVRVTYDRDVALKREDVEFLTWDHPMVVGVMDLILSTNLGNASVMVRKKAGSGKTFIETFYKLQSVAPKSLNPDKYFPPTPIRVLIDSASTDFTDKFSKDDIDEKIQNADPEMIKKAKSLPKEPVMKVVKAASEIANNKAQELKAQYKNHMLMALKAEKERLEKLKAVNPVVRQEEIDALEGQMQFLSLAYDEANITLDSIRIIF